MDSRMEQGVPVGLRNRVVRGPAVLLCSVDKRHVYVPVRGRVVRHHGDGAPLHDGCAAPLEHVAASEDGQTDVWYGRRKWPQRHHSSLRRSQISQERLLF